jgi:hypothetical protein
MTWKDFYYIIRQETPYLGIRYYVCDIVTKQKLIGTDSEKRSEFRAIEMFEALQRQIEEIIL